MSIIYGSFLIVLLITIASVVGGWKINQKAGRPGWAALIPFYGSYVLADVAWDEGWMFLLDLVPASSVIYKIMTAIKLVNYPDSKEIGAC